MSRTPYYRINWQLPVKTKADLPEDDEIGTGRFVEEENAVYILDENGWERLTPLRAGEGLS